MSSDSAQAWWLNPIAQPDTSIAQAAQARQAQLTKPAGSLGLLEEVAVRIASLQGRERPQIGPVFITIFAADHGVVAEGVSLFPAAVTVEMIRNFSRGGAAISVLARQQNARLEVINVGTRSAVEALPQVQDRRIAAGTANFTQAPAMTSEQLFAALAVGRDAVAHLQAGDCPVFIGGEMGIGNTTAASALACALLKAPVELLVGPGTGLDAKGISHKADVIAKALKHHGLDPDDPLTCLQTVGGLEIAALCGAYLHCAQRGIPVLVDGFICSVAALTVLRLQPQAQDWFFFAHQSAEPGFQVLMQALQTRPLLQLDMRLGEGSGAAVALSLLRHACSLHNEMATFAEAAVSRQQSGELR